MSLPDFFSAAPDTHRIFFMRHGESEGNAGGILQGRSNYPLTPLGKRQAEAAAGWFIDQSIDLVLSSPQTRARATADIVSRTIRERGQLTAFAALDGLSEVDLGCFTGLTMDEAQQRHPEIHRRVQYETWDAVPDAEHSETLRERAIQIWKTIIDRLSEHRNVLVVSHGGFLQWLIKAGMGADHSRWNLRIHSSNCGIHECNVMRRSDDHVVVEWRRINMVVAPPEGA